MSIVNLSKNELAKAIVLFGIGEDFEKIHEMEVIESESHDLLKDVKLIVGGVELDFERVVKRIGDQLDVSVRDKTTDVLINKLSYMVEGLDEMITYIEAHKEMFTPDWKAGNDVSITKTDSTDMTYGDLVDSLEREIKRSPEIRYEKAKVLVSNESTKINHIKAIVLR